MLLGRAGGLLWLYALVPVPLLTDWAENGELPVTPRGWITEVIGGLVIAVLVAKVRRDRRALEALARTDGLTGLLNRRTFEAAIELECARARRLRSSLSIVYLDIDDFKRINDRFGHAAGDEVLRRLTSAIGFTVRAQVDGAYRLGGDEFALILPASSRFEAESVVQRLRAACAAEAARAPACPFAFSAGIVDLEPEETAAALLLRSDRAMYLQKEARRLQHR